VAFRLSAFYFAFFAYAGAYVAYFPLYLAERGLSAAHIAWVLAIAPVTRIFAPPAWGWLADRTGAHRAIVVFSCAVTAAAHGRDLAVRDDEGRILDRCAAIAGNEPRAFEHRDAFGSNRSLILGP